MARTKYPQAEGKSPRSPARSRRSGRSALALPTSPRSDTALGKALEGLHHTSSIRLRSGEYDGAATEAQPHGHCRGRDIEGSYNFQNF